MTQFPVIWAVAGGVWLLRTTLLADIPAHRDYDPTGELVDFVVASVCLDLILAGSGTFSSAELPYLPKLHQFAKMLLLVKINILQKMRLLVK